MSKWPCEEVTLDLYNVTPWYDVRLWVSADSEYRAWSDLVVRACNDGGTGSNASYICHAIAEAGAPHGLNAVQVMSPRQVNPNGQLLPRVDIGHMIYTVPFDK